MCERVIITCKCLMAIYIYKKKNIDKLSKSRSLKNEDEINCSIITNK